MPTTKTTPYGLLKFPHSICMLQKSELEKEIPMATAVHCYDNTDDFAAHIMHFPPDVHVVPLGDTEDYKMYNTLKQWLECFTFNKQTT